MTTYTHKYYMYGTVAGVIATTATHPFFTLKTYLQNNEYPPFTNKFSHNFKLLYSGYVRSCIGYSIEKSLVFGTYNMIINKFNLERNNSFHTCTAGLLSGIFASFSITPFEQLTIDKQKNIKNFSIIHLYKGLYPTLIRESVGFSIYFTVYDNISYIINPNKDMYKTICIGSLSIVSAWCIITPIDKIKTNIQSNTKIDIKNIISAYKGFKYALMRAVPFHVICFIVFEELQKIKK